VELHLLDEKFDEAIDAIRHAHKFASRDDQDEVRALLREAMLGAIRQDFAANTDLAAEVEELLDAPDQLASFLRLKAKGKQESGELLEAFKIYQRLIALDNSAESKSTSAIHSTERIARNVEVRRGRWLRARIA
jgi:tetratricopeptide (TPR) repeat protein